MLGITFLIPWVMSFKWKGKDFFWILNILEKNVVIIVFNPVSKLREYSAVYNWAFYSLSIPNPIRLDKTAYSCYGLIKDKYICVKISLDTVKLSF